MKRIIIIGWGRMGITHASIINGLYPAIFNFEIVETNLFIKKVTEKSFGYVVHRSTKTVDFRDALVLITTPPFFHEETVASAIKGGALSIFVEKPFGLHDKRVVDSSIISVGYVLRFTEVAQQLKKIVNLQGCNKIKLMYNSNTITAIPKGWRNTEYGGVLNEMGSHLIDLAFYISGNKSFEIVSSRFESVISNVDDKVIISAYLGSVEFELTLNWVNSGYRKPVWSGEIITNEGVVNFDQQSIDMGIDYSQVDYYVRGRDFSLQMKHFIELIPDIKATSKEANAVHDFIVAAKRK